MQAKYFLNALKISLVDQSSLFSTPAEMSAVVKDGH
jgi:hypothetical protein